jgi:uncharacterized lipoprotein YddW (UPF0748 family)
LYLFCIYFVGILHLIMKSIFITTYCFLFLGYVAIAQNNFKGVWLSPIGTKALNSQKHIDSTVALCKQKGITDIFMVVWNRGYTYYKSPIMFKEFGKAIEPAFKQRDPLQELIVSAHKQNIKVHAWFEFGFSSDYKDTGSHIIKKHPEWLAKTKDGKDVVKNGFRWMNAFDPKVQNFILSLLTEVVKNYDVDGIQGDDRLPANPTTAGYDALTTTLYKKSHKGALPPLNGMDSAWVQWRANILNVYAKKIYTTIKKIKPNVLVSMAPSIFPWSKYEYLQDWPTWLRNGYVDFVIPQVYRYKIDAYKKTLEAQLAMLTPAEKQKFYVGMLTSLGDGYLVDKTFFAEMQAVNKELNVAGECYFYIGKIDKFLPDISVE